MRPAADHKILLIEDEVAIADSVAYSLRHEGFKVEVALDGLAGLSAYRTFSPELIILDLTVPKLSGPDFCRTVRKQSSIPIIMLTADAEHIDRVIGLEHGPDDYVVKPFSVRDLVTRVKAVLRRSEVSRDAHRPSKVCSGAITMDVARRRVTLAGRAIHLPFKQFELLRVLMMNQSKPVTRHELFKAAWDADAPYNAGKLDVHIRWLREKIETDPSHPRYIRTIRRVGYTMVPDTDD